MSSSESKASLPPTPASKKGSDTSSIPTDLTVSSNGKQQLQVSEKMAALEEENRLLKQELKNKETQIQILRVECEKKVEQSNQAATEAERGKLAAEQAAKLRMDLQTREMGKIQAAINQQLGQVTQRQQVLEEVNLKLRQRADQAKQELQEFTFQEQRPGELANIRECDMSLGEFAELLIYRHVLPEREKYKSIESYNRELTSRLGELEREASRLQSATDVGRRESEDLRQKLVLKDSELNQIRNSLKELEGWNKALQQKISATEAAQGGLLAELAAKQHEADTCRQELESLNRDIRLRTSENINLSKNLVSVQKELQDIKIKCELIEQKSDTGLSNLSSLSRTMQKKQMELLEQLGANIFQNNLDKKYREQYLVTIKELVTEQIRTQQHIARIGSERDALEREKTDLTVRCKNSQMEAASARLDRRQEEERANLLAREVDRLERKLAAVSTTTAASHNQDQQLQKQLQQMQQHQQQQQHQQHQQHQQLQQLDVKNSKEYKMLLRDLRLLLSHRDEISAMKELIVKLQQEEPV